jgi:hypothetical protein
MIRQMQATCPLCDFRSTPTRDPRALMEQLVRHLLQDHGVDEAEGIQVEVIPEEVPQ